jgi:hypothetical protein
VTSSNEYWETALVQAIGRNETKYRTTLGYPEDDVTERPWGNSSFTNFDSSHWGFRWILMEQ